MSGFGGNGWGDGGDDEKRVWIPSRRNGQARYGRDLRPANNAIAASLGSHELSQALRPHMAKAIWAKVVGPQVSAVTQAVAIRGGDVLVVRTKNGVWANELTLLKDDILRRLNRALGGRVIADIYFGTTGLRDDAVAAPVPPEPEPPKPKAREIELAPISPRKVLEIEGKVAGVKDPGLRSRLRDNLIRMAQASEWKLQNGWIACENCGSLALPRPEKPGAHLCDVCHVKQMRRR